MSHYWTGDNAWTNPPSHALPWQREGRGGGGLEYGSGAFDVTNQSWPYPAASDTLDGFFDPSPLQADVPTVPPTESHTLLHQTSNSVPVSIDDEMQYIFNQLGPNELADSRNIWNADQFDFNGISPLSSSPTLERERLHCSSNSDANLGHSHSGPPSSGSEWELYSDYQSNPSRPASASPFPGDFDWHDDSEVFQESASAFAPPLASDLERPAKGKKAETNTQGKVSAARRSSSRVASRGVELERDDIQDDEHEGT
ncbi:hypothetical protein B0H19DRAFT_1369986 [Mycena capillaripes]|nr:hypothetical protein B0H19DRAFT_1369986 [Mycena capillaripes]